MDLVKSHLMTAVRSEVEELRDKISKLEDTVNHLSRENEVLRANVNPEVLTSLLGNRSILGSLPPDPDPGDCPRKSCCNQPIVQHSHTNIVLLTLLRLREAHAENYIIHTEMKHG